MENEELKKEIVDFIKDRRSSTPEEVKLIRNWVWEIVFTSIFRFGFGNLVAKDALSVLKEFIRVCKIENDIFSIIWNNLDRIDVNETIDYLYYLDDLSRKTFLYYYEKVLPDMECAIQINDINRAKRAKYDFNMLIDEENPLEEVYSLIKKNSQQS